MAFEWRSNQLHVDGVPLADVARAAGTPVWVYSAGLIVERLRRLRRAFDGLDPQIRYAVKANGNAALLRLMMREGAGFDLVSGGELLRALRAGAAPESMVFAGVGKQDWEMRLALRAGIGMFNVESEDELHRIGALARGEGRSARMALRVNPDVAVSTHAYITTGRKKNKFGMDLPAAARLVGAIHDHPSLELVAYHVHLGSLLREPEQYLEACRRVMDFIDADPAHGRGVRYYDAGGGFATDGPFSDGMIDLHALAAGLRDLLAPRKLGLLLEPGRLVVGDAGVLVTSVLYMKPGGEKDFCIIDAGMNDLIRPALYDARHEILTVQRGGPAGPRPVDVVGPVCESADFLGVERELPRLEPGDLLAVCSAGAYGFVMGSNYNARPLAPEVLCEDGAARLIRHRESAADLWRGETDEGLDLRRVAGDPPFPLPEPSDASWKLP